MTAPLLLFDGVCNLCNGAVDFIVRHEATPVLRFASLQSEVGRQQLAACGLPHHYLESLVLVESGGCYRGSLAALRAAYYMGGAWKALWLLRAVPAPIREGVYNQIAQNRYSMFGKRDTCRLPTPEERARFLG